MNIKHSALLDSQLDEFDLAWARALQGASEPPAIAEYAFGECDELRSQSLLCLACIDIEYRWQLSSLRQQRLGGVHQEGTALESCRTDPIRYAEYYLQEFPLLSLQDVHVASLVCAEFRIRQQNGERPELSELLKRFPNISGLDAALSAVVSEDQREAKNIPDLPGFEVVAELGRGGRAVVYKAWQPQLRRFVALKILHQSHSLNDEDRARFRREAVSLAKLQHPNIVSVYALVEAEGQLVLVMEWVEGQGLDLVLTNEHLPVATVISYMIDVADAIEHAHENGVLHRDLKPANILIDRHGMAHVTDFGLAKNFSEESQHSSMALTQTREIVGTPCYMPPEQIDGKLGPMGPTADVYAIGATLYNMLTGRPPLKGSSTWETFQLVLENDPVSTRSLNPNIPSDIDTICMRCLEKQSGQRYQSAAAVAEELRRFERGEPILARPISRLAHLRRWAVRHPREALLWAGMFIAMLATATVTTISSVNYSRLYASEQLQRKQTELALDRSESSRYLSSIQQGFMQFQSHNLSEVADILKLTTPRKELPDRRDWEWFYLNGLIQSGERRFQGASGQANWVGALAISRNGRWLACGSSVPWYESMPQDVKAQVTVWDLESGAKHFACEVPGNSVASVALSDTGTRLAVVTNLTDRVRIQQGDGTQISKETNLEKELRPDPKQSFATPYSDLAVYDLAEKRKLWETRDLAANFVSLDFSSEDAKLFPQTSTLITLSAAGLTAWTADSGMSLWKKPDVLGFQTGLNVIKYRTSIGDFFAEARTGNSVTLESKTLEQEMRPFRWLQDMGVVRSQDDEFSLPTYSLDFSGKYETVASNSEVKVRDRQSGEVIASFQTSQPSACILGTRQMLAVGRSDGVVDLFDVEDRKLVRSYSGHKSMVRQLVFSHDEKRLVSGDWDGQVIVWNLDKESNAIVLGDSAVSANYPVEAFSVESDRGQTRAIQIGRSSVRSWNTNTSAELDSFQVLGEVPQIAPGRAAAISGKGNTLAYVSKDSRQQLNILDVEEQDTIAILKSDAPIQFVTADDSGRYVAFASWNRKAKDQISEATVSVFDCVQARQVFSSRIAQRRVWRLSLCAATNRLALVATEPSGPSASIDSNVSHSLSVWDFITGKELWNVSLPSDCVLCLGLAFSLDGSQLASATLVGDIQLWDALDGSNKVQLDGRLEDAEDICFNPTGTRLAGVTRNQFSLWSTKYGQRIITLPKSKPNFDPIYNPQVRFSADGSQIVTNQFDETLQILVGVNR